MNNKEIDLLVTFLDDYSDVLSNNSCNDWDFPDNWSTLEKHMLVEAYHRYNGSSEDYWDDVRNKREPYLMDYMAVAILCERLKELKDGQPK